MKTKPCKSGLEVEIIDSLKSSKCKGLQQYKHNNVFSCKLLKEVFRCKHMQLIKSSFIKTRPANEQSAKTRPSNTSDNI